MRSALAIVLLVLASSFCAHAETQGDNGLIERVRKAVVHHNLTPRPACVSYLLTHASTPGIDRVDVEETHNAACGGDPQVEHRLFSVFVDQKTKQMASDADDPVNGTLTVLTP